ncbi:MAG: hydantoinase B/oxoprolinase family protein [Gammaproteobacteria bacterium]|nr:hydantoinase B/oxoprolinase family protein [Gammaproteobacteria bacterium]
MTRFKRPLLPPYDPALITTPLSDDEIAGLPGALDGGDASVDPVTFSVVYARLDGILSEMTETILTTARNPILYGAKDFTCTVMTTRAEVLSMHDCLPVHVGTMSPALRFVIRAFGDDIHEGDVFVNNASFAGNAHVGDWTMFAPIFFAGRLVAWAVNKCHIIDTGAHIPSNVDFYAKDVYEEALHFPAVRLCRDHQPIEDLVRFIAYNFRFPELWHGDFLAQLGSLWTAESRVQELCTRFGYGVVKGCFAEALRYGERRMREEIARLPARTVEVAMIGEKIAGFFPDGVPLKLRLEIDPAAGRIHFDYTDMPDQQDFGYNLSYATARCSALQGTLPLLDPGIPPNDGALNCIEVTLREGALAGIPRWPVGTSAATIALCDEVTNLVFKAWAEVLPERAMAGMGEYCAANFIGSGTTDHSGESYVHVFYLAASGGGAVRGHDGIPHMFGACIMGNMGYESIELVELARPLIVWETTAVIDSGGAGEFRGAVGVRQRIQPVDHTMHIGYCGSGHTCAAFGLDGGQAGMPADHWIVEQASDEVYAKLANAGAADVAPTQAWVAQTGGGGGAGLPHRRAAEAVLADVVDGFVSLAAAREVYGVVLEDSDGTYAIDLAATAALRAGAQR